MASYFRRSSYEGQPRERDLKPVKRTDSHRPSLGDSVFAMYDAVKNVLGPREK